MIRDATLDLSLQDLTTNVDRLYLCSQVPTTFAEASATYDVAVKTSIVLGSPTARTGGGRRVVVPAVTDGVVNAGGGTVTHYALVNFAASTLYAVKALSTSKVLVDTDPWTCDAFDIGIYEIV